MSNAPPHRYLNLHLRSRRQSSPQSAAASSTARSKARWRSRCDKSGCKKVPSGSHRTLCGGQFKHRRRRRSHRRAAGDQSAIGTVGHHRRNERTVGRSIRTAQNRKVKADNLGSTRRHIACIVGKGSPGRLALTSRKLRHIVVKVDGLSDAAQVSHRQRELDRLIGHHRTRCRRQHIGKYWRHPSWLWRHWLGPEFDRRCCERPLPPTAGRVPRIPLESAHEREKKR
jgi:hypothetical protein